MKKAILISHPIITVVRKQDAHCLRNHWIEKQASQQNWTRWMGLLPQKIGKKPAKV